MRVSAVPDFFMICLLPQRGRVDMTRRYRSGTHAILLMRSWYDHGENLGRSWNRP